jgi:hypothetical protein
MMNETVTDLHESADETGGGPPLPPARHALVAAQRALASLRATLDGHKRRREKLAPQLDTYNGMRAEHDQGVAQHQDLRARQLLGESIDERRMRDLERRRELLVRNLGDGAYEAAALSRAVASLDQDIGQIAGEIAARERDLPGLLANAGFERTLDALGAGRLQRLVAHIAEELAHIYAGANVHELQRLKDERIRPLISIRNSRERDAIVLPMLIDTPPFDNALASAAMDVMTIMQERALALLDEFTAPTK